MHNDNTSHSISSQEVASNQFKQQPSSVFQLAGEITWLMARSPNHQYLFINELMWLLFPPMELEQYHIFRSPNGHIAGVALWAYVNEDVDKRLNILVPRLMPHEWKCGENIWLVDLIAPFGQQDEMLSHLKRSIFSDKKVKVQRQSEDGSVKVVYL